MEKQTIVINASSDALLTVDVQPTFMPGGGLPVTGGDEIVPLVGRLNLLFPARRRFFTLDRHPLGHVSLASTFAGLPAFSLITSDQVAGWAADDALRLAPHARFGIDELKGYLSKVGQQVLWPDHALAGTAESMLHPAFEGMPYRTLLIKGMDFCCDSYSAFRDNLRRPTGLAETMRSDGIRRVFLTGLAYDFCVGWSALDAADAGFEAIYVVRDATRAVGMPLEGAGQGLTTADMMDMELIKRGIGIIESDYLIAV